MRSLVILLAEDNPGDVLLVRQALREHFSDIEMFVADTGEKAAALLDRVGKELPRPDVLVLDLNLPGVEGTELFQKVRDHPLCADTPIVVVTSSNSPKDRAWTATFGIAHYFRKPSDFDEFMKLGAVVREIVDSSGRNGPRVV